MMKFKFKYLYIVLLILGAVGLVTSCSDGHHIDAPSEALTVTIESLNKSCISISKNIPFKLTFSKAVTNFNSSKLIVINGTLGKISGGPTVYNGTVFSDGSDQPIQIFYDKKGAVDEDGFLNPPSNKFEILPLSDILVDKLSCGSFGPVCCIINANEQVKCWGSGAFGSLGQDSTNTLGDQPGEMEVLGYINLGEGVVSISASGNYHTCAVLKSGRAKCWGNNNRGQLGYDDIITRGDGSAAPYDMASLPYIDLTGFKQIVTGAQFSCGLFENGEVKCWGGNSSGQLGVIDTAQNRGDELGEMANLQPVPLGEVATQITASRDGAVCALLESGNAKCWGRNSSGELGYDDSINRTADTHDLSLLPYLNLGEKVVQISIETSHACALLESGFIKCWGRNSRGKLGYDDTNARGNGSAAPYDMDSLQYVSLGQKAIKVFAADANSCAILADQSVKCWGGNPAGALGAGDNFNRGDGSPAPYDMASLDPLDLGGPVVDINGGAQYACVRLARNACEDTAEPIYKCWGRGHVGQLGNNSTDFIGDDPGEMEAIEPIVNL